MSSQASVGGFRPAAVDTAARATERPSLLVLFGWLGFLAAFTYVILIGGGYAGISSGTLRQLSLAIIALGLLAWALLARRRPEWRPRSGIWAALVVPFTALVVTTLTSPFPRLAVDYLAWAVLLIALYLLLVRILARPFVQARIGGLLAILGIAVGLAYIAIVVARWFEWWELLGRLTAPMLRPTYAGLPIGGPTVVASVVILLAVSAAAGLGAGSSGRRIVLALLTATTLTAVVLTGSRGSWLALAVAAAVIGLGVALAERHRLAAMVTGRLADRRARLALGAAAGVAVLAGLALAPALIERLSSTGDGGRAYYFATAQRMFEASPLIGHGPGTWAALRLPFTQPGEPDIYVAHAHNVYIQTLAETGVLGALAGVVALLVVLRLVVGALRGSDPVRRRWSLAAAFVLIYVAAYSLLDSYANLPGLLMLVALPVAFLDATRRVEPVVWEPAGSRGISPQARRRLETIAGTALFVAAFLAVAALARIESVAATHARAVAAIEDGEWGTATEAARRAAKEDPDLVPYQVTRGLVAAREGDWGTALEAFERAAVVDAVPETWMNVALARLETGQPPESVLEVMAEARRIESHDPFMLLASAELFDRLGMTDEADAAYANLLAVAPSLAGDPSWRSERRLADRFDRAYGAALEQTAIPWELALMAGDLERARVLAGETGDPIVALIVDAWTGDDEALAGLQVEALAHPERADLVSWVARASAAAGDAEAAAVFRRIGEFENESAARPGYELRVLDRGRDPVAGAVPLTHGYGSNDYRRGTPGHLLAPGLSSLVLVDLADDGQRPQR